MTVIAFHVPGTPEPWRRARSHGAMRFTDPRSRAYTGHVQVAWRRAGATRLPDGPVRLTITAVFPRPPGHHLRDGTLSAAGRRAVLPAPCIDVDNIAKAVMDALNGHAWRDDRWVVHLTARKQWSTPGRCVGVHVHATTDRRLEART